MKHIFRKIDPRVVDNLHDGNLDDCAKYLYRAYNQCMRRMQNFSKKGVVDDYNLVLTKRWMFVVIRKQDSIQNISCNSLGYIGFLFVKDAERRMLLDRMSPYELLSRLAMPASNQERHSSAQKEKRGI